MTLVLAPQIIQLNSKKCAVCTLVNASRVWDASCVRPDVQCEVWGNDTKVPAPSGHGVIYPSESAAAGRYVVQSDTGFNGYRRVMNGAIWPLRLPRSRTQLSPSAGGGKE